MPVCFRRMLSRVLIPAVVVCIAMQPPDAQAQPQAPGSPGQDCGPVDRGMITAGQTVTGRIDACHQEEYWDFDGVRGQAVIITMDRPDPPTFGGLEMDPFLRLLRPAGDGDRMVESENDDGGIGVNARIDRRLMASGRYRIVATSFEGATGDYLLRLSIIGANATDRGTILPDETVRGRVDGDNPEDAWWFDGVAGQRVLIAMQRPRPMTLEGITLDPLLYLFSPENGGMTTIIDVNDDGGDDVDSLIVGRLEQTGRFRIVATRVTDSFGEYRLTLRLENASE
jgi:hypothetical protein